MTTACSVPLGRLCSAPWVRCCTHTMCPQMALGVGALLLRRGGASQPRPAPCACTALGTLHGGRRVRWCACPTENMLCSWSLPQKDFGGRLRRSQPRGPHPRPPHVTLPVARTISAGARAVMFRCNVVSLTSGMWHCAANAILPPPTPRPPGRRAREEQHCQSSRRCRFCNFWDHVLFCPLMNEYQYPHPPCAWREQLGCAWREVPKSDGNNTHCCSDNGGIAIGDAIG